MTLHVHRSATGLALADGLAGVLAGPLADPFTPDVVAVPAQGVERWLAQRLSHRLGRGVPGPGPGQDDGVCAGVVFARPAALLDAALAGASPDHRTAVEAWAPERVPWTLLDVLDACPDEAWCRTLRHHVGLDGEQASTRRWAVSRRLSASYLRVAAERPALLRRWAAGGDDVPDDLRWLPELWRRLRAALGTPSPAELLNGACASLRDRDPDRDLPERLSVYGASRLSASRLQVLAALAERREVHLFVHHASPALWEALAAVGPDLGDAPRRVAAPVLAGRVRHPLLASLSRDVQELQLRLTTAAPHLTATEHPAADAPRPTLLARLQADLRADRVPTGRLVLDPTDRSVQVHACHGQARQVEVLREVVLGLLADDPTLEPRDVLVMCPDVETYAPLVTAAFAAAHHPGSGLRVTIADRAPRQTNPLLGVAATLLALAGSRVTGPQVLDLVDAPAVRRRFRLDDDDVESLRSWVVGAGVHWGIDERHRAAWGLERLHQGTWRSGLDRLLAGVVAGEADGLLGGVLPLDGTDSSDVELVGRLVELLDRLETALARLAGPQPVGEWLDALGDGVAALTEVADDESWQSVQLRRELGEVAAAAAGREAGLTLSDARELFAERLGARPTRTSFRTGGLTVCTLVPMRSVPHRVVCLLGLDDGAFPRSGLPDGDDPLARDPLVGDRDPRSEDRQLFLDAITAAQEHLVLTYRGADLRTGEDLPPAVPLGELLDALDLTGATRDGRPARAQVVVRHPLQPTDARNFLPGALSRVEAPLSFDVSALRGARAAAAGTGPWPGFLDAPLPPPDREPDVALQRLLDVVQHPARAFLRQRLDVAGSARNEEPEPAMPVELDGLTKWAVGERLLQARLTGAERRRIGALELARGELPPAPLADALLREIGSVVDGLLVSCSECLDAAPETLDVEVPLPDGRRLLGEVGGVRGKTVLTVTYATVKAKHRARAWVELLALAAAHPGRVGTARLVGRGDRGRRGEQDKTAVHTLAAPPAAEAATLLAELVALRDAGLRQVLPLPVGPAAAYAEARRQRRDPASAMGAARSAWQSTFTFPGDDTDADHRLVWGGTVPFATVWERRVAGGAPGRGWDGEPGDFARLARRVWEPLLDAETVAQR